LFILGTHLTILERQVSHRVEFSPLSNRSIVMLAVGSKTLTQYRSVFLPGDPQRSLKDQDVVGARDISLCTYSDTCIPLSSLRYCCMGGGNAQLT
jgi:hypothetical protein